jgi:tRNA(His) 5'-end guanylyltransferase
MEIFSPRFSLIHSFDKPNDETALRLMNASASLMMEQFPDIIFGYGFNNEYRYDIPFPNSCVCMEKTAKRTDKTKICVSA